jgi:hypothetical protein
MIPQNLRAGDDILIVTDLASKYPLYTLDAGYSLTLTLVSTSGRQEITATGIPLVFAANGAVSKLWIPGAYTYVVTFTRGTERHTVDTGSVQVLPDVFAQTTFDGRTSNQQILEAVKAAILKLTTSGVNSYTIAGRSLTNVTLADLEKMRAQYSFLVMVDERKFKNAIWARL